MRRLSPALRRRLQRVRCLLMDVDGVLTDGGLHYGSDGQEFKTFNVLDGHGIVMARKAGLLVGFLSARPSTATLKRAADLGVPIVKVAPVCKSELLAEVLREHKLTAEQVAFVGDELVDLPVLRRVGFAASVPNAVSELKAHVHYTTKRAGGSGAIREVVELILKARGLWQAQLARYLAVVTLGLWLGARAVLAAEPSGYIEKFEVPERDEKGNLLWKLTGDRAHFGTNGMLSIQNARAEYYTSNRLSGVFTTPFCVLDRANSRASTESPVRIERENMIVTGTGGVWDGKRSLVSIHSNVQVLIPSLTAKPEQDKKP